MSNQPINTTTDGNRFFNRDHSRLNPTSLSDVEFHMARWTEENNTGAQAACTLKRGSVEGVYICDLVLEMERFALFSSVKGAVNISFAIVNGQSMAGGYEEFVAKLDGADLSRLDDIVF
jgi:hypothetical protein